MPPTDPLLGPIAPQTGRPLYLSVRDAIRSAVDGGAFPPGTQLPSTKELSETMNVSLVTMHRALQELVASGVLSRSQGKGTFVSQRYLDAGKRQTSCRVGLVIHAEASLADYYHGQVLEGVRQAGEKLTVDLMLLRFGEDVRNECDGYLLLNPLAGQESKMMEGGKQPMLVVGARPASKRVGSIDVDNQDVARQAVKHLVGLGHRNIAYVGATEGNSNSADRWTGFVAAMSEHGLVADGGDKGGGKGGGKGGEKGVGLVRSQGWRLDERERVELIRCLSGPAGKRPTAVFAAGYYFALDVLTAAETVGLKVPEQLSVVGVDDPPSAAHLSPPLTTLRQPLVRLGHAAITALVGQVRKSPGEMKGSRTLLAELVVRRSTASPEGSCAGPALNGHGAEKEGPATGVSAMDVSAKDVSGKGVSGKGPGRLSGRQY